MGERVAVATAQASTTLSAQKLIAILLDVPLPEFFTRWFIFPAIVRVQDQVGPWRRIGQERTAVFADGGTVHERLVRYDAQHGWINECHFTGTFGHLVSVTYDEWLITTVQGRTQITWNWYLHAKRGRGALVGRVIRPIFARYLQRMLNRTLRRLDH